MSPGAYIFGCIMLMRDLTAETLEQVVKDRGDIYGDITDSVVTAESMTGITAEMRGVK